MKLDEKIRAITANIEAAEAKLQEIDDTIDYLEAVGMYPSEGKEQWQTRPNSSGEYLYMIFRSDRNGGYKGPGGKRKIYVGTNPEAIAEARVLNENYRMYEQLKFGRRQMNSWIYFRRRDVESIEKQVEQQFNEANNIPDIPELTVVANKLPGLE